MGIRWKMNNEIIEELVTLNKKQKENKELLRLKTFRESIKKIKEYIQEDNTLKHSPFSDLKSKLS